MEKRCLEVYSLKSWLWYAKDVYFKKNASNLSHVILGRVDYLVLDESDKLFELGFVKQIDSVVKACSNPSIIRSLFSATLPDSVEELARSIMHDAVRVIIGRKWV